MAYAPYCEGDAAYLGSSFKFQPCCPSLQFKIS